MFSSSQAKPFCCFLLVQLFCLLAEGYKLVDRTSSNFDAFYPSGITVGSVVKAPASGFKQFSLTASNPLATLDYGLEVAGYPFFEVISASGKVQIEVKYTEEFSGLSNSFADGPYAFAVQLSNTYRVETFQVTGKGQLQSSLLQGGQRWQSIRLLTAGSITFRTVGFKATVSTEKPDDLPGHFESDNSFLNDVWKLGAHAATVACVESGSQGALWNVDSKNGAYVRGMRHAVTGKADRFSNYTLEFDTKIDRGGSGWAMSFPLSTLAGGLLLNLNSELPPSTSFVNTNKTVMPPSSIVLAYGWSFVNQTTLPTYYLDAFKVPFAVKENKWYRIRSSISNGYLSVSLDGKMVFNVSLTSYYAGSATSATLSTGAFGFGGWQDQASYVRNVKAYDIANGSLLYSNPLTDAATVLPEYGVQENRESVCLDGPKRDRLVWLGDFAHTSSIIGVSTSRFDLARGTLNYLLDWQASNGQMSIDPAMGYDAAATKPAFDANLPYALGDYQILGLIAFGNYVKYSNDLKFAKQTWSKWQGVVNWVLSRVDPSTGLWVDPKFAFLGPVNGSLAVSCAAVQALNGVADVATSIGDSSTAQKYKSAADTMASAINTRLWNSALGVYALSPASPNDFSTSGVGFCISSGVANQTQAESSIAALSALKLWPGYKDSTQVNSSDPNVNISPNTNGFLLAGILKYRMSAGISIASDLLQTLWGAMVKNPLTNTGASWEYVSQTGDPGLGLFTSLAHPWGGAATYIITEYGAGLQMADGIDGFGYKNWVVNPTAGLQWGLKQAKATVVTAYNSNIQVSWNVKNGRLNVVITAPKVTAGVFEYGGKERTLSGKSKYEFSVST